ncbi:MAG: tyrosine-type recombinase/integrase [Alphaproteobacteria bacterium]|nr:tyrosine-type recombinase/integrase [Alphaproteobacteria bacterium]MBP9777339.1 tyrosine-type recombinase/integrase [Alphaproteobacteria bacterium]
MSSKKSNKVKLTKRVVESATPDSSKRIVLWDTEITGLCVRIYPSGKKTYFLQYRNKNRETHKVKIGVHGTITTELAREQAVKLSLNISIGEDPSVKVISANKGQSMQELAEQYLSLHAKLKKAPKGYKEDSAILKDVILKKYARMKVDAISIFDLQKLHSELQETPYRANRVRALLSKMFNLAVQWGWRSDNPVIGVEKYQEYKRHRWLDAEEAQRLFPALATYYNQSVANAIRLLLLTGSRRNEVLHATWEQFDLEKGIWTKPAHTTKQRRMEHLPLSFQVIEMLKDMKTEAESPFLFPGKVPGKPLQEIKKAWDTIRKRAGLPDVRLHDLRHTYASHLVSSGLSLSIVGKLLGHTQASTTQRYAHLADKPLREATELFGSKMEKLASSNEMAAHSPS